MGEIHEFFVLALSLIWFAGATPEVRKILVSVKIFARNSGAGTGCANCMGAWKNAFFLQEKPMPIKFLVLGGGILVFLGGGGECRFYFYGREDFSESVFVNFSRLSQLLPSDTRQKPGSFAARKVGPKQRPHPCWPCPSW